MPRQKLMLSLKIHMANVIYEVTWQCDVTDVTFKKTTQLPKVQMSAPLNTQKKSQSEFAI